jgi:hypothetical protein
MLQYMQEFWLLKHENNFSNTIVANHWKRVRQHIFGFSKRNSSGDQHNRKFKSH